MNLSKTLWTIGSLIGAQQAVRVARRFELDDLLGILGVERRRSAAQLLLPAIGLVSLGAAVGAGAALLLAPNTGAETRKRLAVRLDQLTDKLNEPQSNHAAPNPTQSAPA
jgi:hypothetical protein